MTRKYKRIAFFIIIFLNPFLISFNFNWLNSYSDKLNHFNTHIPKIELPMKSESYYEEPLLTLKFNSTISPNKNNFIEVKLLDNSIKKLRVHYSIDNGTTWQISPFQYFSDEMKIQNLGRRVMATVVGDSDNDGQNELVVGYGDRNVYNAAHLSIYEWNETNYSYVETHQMNLPLSPHSIVVGDADNDGSNEIIVGMWSYYLYQFDWDGSSYLKTTIINSYEPYHLYRINGLDIGDLDEDGLNELLVCDISAEHDVYIFKHEAGTYNSIYHSFYNLLGTPGASIGNISNDGLNDFIVGGEFFVRSGNTFESRQNLSYSMGGVKIGDVDADGENEVIRQNIIYRYNANTDLLEEEYSLSPKDAWDCAWLIHLGNFDIDEEFEIVNGRSIDDYNHDGYFEKKWVENNFGDTWGTFVSCGDADNDGFDEFFIGDRNSSWALYDMPIWNSLSNGFFIPATNIETEIKFYFEAVNSSGLFYSNIYSYVTKFPFPIDYSDDFNSPTLDPKWMWHLDSGSQASWSLSANPGHLRISCSGVATNWETGVHDVPYMYQSLPSGDWEIEVKVSEPTSNDQTNGIIVYKSSNEWIMFANDYDSVGEMSLLRANLGGTLDNYAGGDRGNNHPYLKLKKVGTTYSCYGSADGNIWNYYGDLSTSIIFSQMGIFAHSHLGGVSDTINSDFDYFKFTFINEDHTPPSQAIITSPSTGDNVSRIVNINAIAEDNLEGSGIAYVEFWDGVPGVPGFLIGTDHSAPYSISWDSCLAVDGFRDLYIRVYDHTGNYLDSSAVTVTVDNTAPYRANIISPTRWVIVKGNISITADAIDSGTGVDYVEFWDGLPGTGSLIGTDSWAPYSVNWDTTAAGAGPHTLYVRAYDYAGNYLDGNSVGVTVQEIYNYSEELQLLWNTTWGGSNKDYGLGVVVDPNGSIYCTGWTESFGAGGWDSALVKFAPNGTKLWNTTWGGSDRDWLYGVELDSSGFLYCVGYTESFGAGDGDLALVKFAPNGTKLWDTTWGGWGYDCGYKIAIDATGAIYCLGDTLTFGAGGYDFALVKFHPNGTKAWHTTWGDSATDRGSGVAVDANGFIYCVGYTQTPGRGAYEPYDFALVKFAPNGTKLWNTRWGGSDHDWGQSVVVDATGALYCTGITQSFGEGGWDFAFVKFAPNGTKLWNTTWGGSRNDECYGMVADASGAIYCAGQTNSFGTGSWDWALVKFNPNGIKLWDTTWGGSGDDFCREVTVDATGAIYCTGFTPSLGVNRYDLALVKFGFKPLEPPPIITHPSTGDIVSGTITIETNMLEGVKNVTFWLDGIGTGTLLGTDTTSPYSQVWDTTVMGDGSHDLYVRAFDFTGKSSNSSVVTVTVDNTAPTTATITSPSTWDNVSGTTVPIDATAVDVGTGVKNITFWLDGIGTGTLLGTDTAPPYSLNWDTTTTSEGSHDLNVRVFDQAGNYLDSSAVSVVVDNTDPSTATIISPSMGDNLSGTITIDANAIDAGSGVKNVTFWDGLPGIGILLGTDTAFPYSLNWDTTTTSEGSHDLCIQVYDWAGNYLNSIAVTVTVDNTPAGEQWVPCVPSPAQVDLQVWMDNQNAYIDVAITFSNGGYNASSWGEVTNDGYGFSANSEIWQWTGPHTDAFMTISHTYELGYLENGIYTFTFKAWGNDVKSVIFGIDNPPPLEDKTAPNITINMQNWLTLETCIGYVTHLICPESFYNSPPVMDVDFLDDISLDNGYYKVDSYTPAGINTSGWIPIFSNLSLSSFTTDFTMSSAIWNNLSYDSHTVYFKASDDANNVNDGASPSWQFYKMRTPLSYFENHWPVIPSQVGISIRNEGQNYCADIEIPFSTSGLGADWGGATKKGNLFEVNAEVWVYTGCVLQVFTTVTHTYELGHLESGNYTFTFKAWGNDIKNINFVIENSSNDLPEDTIPPTIMPESMTNLTGLEILAGMPVTIKVNVSYAGGISEVWLNYTVDGIPQIPILMTLVDFGNGTIFSRFSGTIPGQPAGSVVNFSITVVDKYGHSYTSNSFSYGVVIEIDSFNFIPMTLIIFTVFGIVVTSLIIYNKLHLQRPRRASLRDIPYHVPSRMMQQHAVNIPSSSLLPNSIFCSYCGFQNDPTKPFCQKCGTEIGPLTSRYISLDNDEYQTIDDGRLEPSDSMTPDYDDYQTIDYNPIDPSDSSLSPSYQNHAGQVEGFTFLHLYGVFTAILKAFPSVAQMFPREERLNYVMELKNLPIEEQYALFNAMIARNSAHEMRNQLNYLMREFKTGETEENWVPALQKLEKFIAVALADGDRELIAELMQLSILIKYSL